MERLDAATRSQDHHGQRLSHAHTAGPPSLIVSLSFKGPEDQRTAGPGVRNADNPGRYKADASRSRPLHPFIGDRQCYVVCLRRLRFAQLLGRMAFLAVFPGSSHRVTCHSLYDHQRFPSSVYSFVDHPEPANPQASFPRILRRLPRFHITVLILCPTIELTVPWLLVCPSARGSLEPTRRRSVKGWMTTQKFSEHHIRSARMLRGTGSN